MAKRTMPDPRSQVRGPMVVGGGPSMRRIPRAVPGIGNRQILTERQRAEIARKMSGR